MLVSGLTLSACDILASDSTDNSGITDNSSEEKGSEEEEKEEEKNDGDGKEKEKEKDNTTKFEGVWKTGIIAGASIRATYKFTDNAFEFTSDDTEETYFSKGPISGTFGFTDTTITFTTSGESPKTWTMEYTFTFKNGRLRLEYLHGDKPTRIDFLTLTKQGSSATGFESFEGTWKHQDAEINAVYVFTGNQWNYTADPNEYGVATGPYSGTFTFDDASITFTVTAGSSGTWAQLYTITTHNNEKTLVLENTTFMLTGLFGHLDKQ
jgi:hypothetical protein